MFTCNILQIPESHTIMNMCIRILLKFRWDMSMSESHYSIPPPTGKARTLAALSENCHFSQPKRHLGSKNPPLLPLEPTSLVLDELHLLLRTGDVLLRNVILQADSLDHKAYMATGRRIESHLRSLELLIQQCGVSFSIASVNNIICYTCPKK